MLRIDDRFSASPKNGEEKEGMPIGEGSKDRLVHLKLLHILANSDIQ